VSRQKLVLCLTSSLVSTTLHQATLHQQKLTAAVPIQAEAPPPITHSNTCLPAFPAACEGHNAEGTHVVAAAHDGHKG
jgi:hypothetical protein